MGISKTFNVSDIHAYQADDDDAFYPDINSRSSSSKVEETDIEQLAQTFKTQLARKAKKTKSKQQL